MVKKCGICGKVIYDRYASHHSRFVPNNICGVCNENVEIPLRIMVIKSRNSENVQLKIDEYIERLRNKNV